VAPLPRAPTFVNQVPKLQTRTLEHPAFGRTGEAEHQQRLAKPDTALRGAKRGAALGAKLRMLYTRGAFGTVAEA